MENRIAQFKKKVTALFIDDAKSLRQLYISKFINTETEYYLKKVATKQKFSDGEFYVGYLWDTLGTWEKICFKNIKKHLPEGNQKVIVMWDIHSDERILVENYWKFGKDDVIELSVDVLIANLDLLPEDIYIFDRGLKWSIVLTHETEGEEDWPDSRIVLKVISSLFRCEFCVLCG